MRRRIGTPIAVGTVVLALGLGSGAGLMLRQHRVDGAVAVNGATVTPRPTGSATSSVTSSATGSSSGSPSTSATPHGSSSPSDDGSARTSVLGAGNVLSAADLIAAGWHGVSIDSVGNGTAQFAKVCQSREPQADGVVTAAYVNDTGEFAQQSSYAFNILPQATTAYDAILALYDRGRCGGSTVTRMTTPTGVTGGVWHITGGSWGASYAVVVRVGDRIGWASLADDRPAVAPAGVPLLATALAKKLAD
ncbi:hypothetical protein [Nocardioides sp.]|uniref:hypothetical protein n=1 Tax=Nocardioides sp. TaxID=35761 RepID=UPI002636474E|nr:hypothetical protein [Nocardioides sp.]